MDVVEEVDRLAAEVERVDDEFDVGVADAVAAGFLVSGRVDEVPAVEAVGGAEANRWKTSAFGSVLVASDLYFASTTARQRGPSHQVMSGRSAMPPAASRLQAC